MFRKTVYLHIYLLFLNCVVFYPENSESQKKKSTGEKTEKSATEKSELAKKKKGIICVLKFILVRK